MEGITVSAFHTCAAHKPEHPRSSEWPAVERAHLREHPTCIACDGTEMLQVHHRVPFHIDRARELDRSNLRTMCMHPDRRCHFLIGHGDSVHGNWTWFNPNVDADAAKALAARRRKAAPRVLPALAGLVSALWRRGQT